jgi:hypothetical protein
VWKVTEVNIVLGKIKLSTEEGRIAQFLASAFEKTEGRWAIKAGATSLWINRRILWEIRF